jgi:hypothetical protein
VEIGNHIGAFDKCHLGGVDCFIQGGGEIDDRAVQRGRHRVGYRMNCRNVTAISTHSGDTRSLPEMLPVYKRCEDSVPHAFGRIETDKQMAVSCRHSRRDWHPACGELDNKVPFRRDLLACTITMPVYIEDEAPSGRCDEVNITQRCRNQPTANIGEVILVFKPTSQCGGSEIRLRDGKVGHMQSSMTHLARYRQAIVPPGAAQRI